MIPAMDFLLPSAWPLFLLLPLTGWFLLNRTRKRRAVLEQMAGARWPSPANHRDSWILLAGLFLGLLSVVQPSWGEEETDPTHTSRDLVLCLDVSRSMLARDLEPNRLDHAKKGIQELARANRGHRLGLILFAGEARLAVPLTRDMESFASLVEGVDTLSILRGGTNLGAALETAEVALRSAKSKSPSLLLITDGEDLEGKGKLQAENLARQGIPIHCAGIGSEQGSKIVLEEEGREFFLQDGGGRDVITVLDAAGLKQLASTTGGNYVALDGGRDFLESLRGSALVEAGQRQPRNAYQWPLLGSFLLLLLHFGRRGGGKP